MCLSPIKIRNNSRSFESGFSPLFREVPCGHCDECQTAIQQDWFVRLAYEYFYTKDTCKGIVYFVTLTYNDKDLPFNYVDEKTVRILNKGLQRLSLLDKDISFKIADFKKTFGFSPYEYVPFGAEYFDYSDITKFVKSLRQNLDYLGYYPYDDEHTLKYFIAPEFGHEKHRVHWHCLFFCPFTIDSKTFLDIVKRSWSVTVKRADLPEYICKLVDEKYKLKQGFNVFDTPNGKHWQDWFLNRVGSRVYVKHLRGNCSYSKDNPPYITGVNGLNYVVKYIHKKDEYLQSEKFNLLSAYLGLFPRSITKDFGLVFKSLEDIVKVLRSYFPRVKTSNYLGISILDEFGLLDDDTIAKMISEKSLSIAGVPRLYHVPAYIANRLMYNEDDIDPSLRLLSDVGVKVVKAKLQNRIEDFVSQFENVRDTCLPFLREQDFDLLAEKYPFANCLKTGCMPFFLPHVAKYLYLFRNVECDDVSLYHDIYEVLDLYEDAFFEKKALRNYDVETPPSAEYKRAVVLKQKHTWNFQPCFAGFDEFLDFYRDVRNIVQSNKSCQRRADYMERVRLRQLYNAPKYNN